MAVARSLTGWWSLDQYKNMPTTTHTTLVHDLMGKVVIDGR